MSRKLSLAVVAALAALALAAVAGAGHIESGVKSYTGCLGGGALSKIKEGNTPASPCAGGQVEAHFSGGDITKISVGSGLSLPNGGDNGEVRIELAAGQALPQGCADDRVAEWDSGTSRWICGIDNDTTYLPGTGLDLSASNNVFSIEPGFRIPGKQCSTAGQFASGFDSNGEIQCAAPAATSLTTVSADQQAYEDGTGIPDDGTYRSYAAVAAPAGTYLVVAKGVIQSARTASAGAACQLLHGGSLVDYTDWPGSVQLGEVYATPFTLVGVATGGAAGLDLQCQALDGADGLTIAFGRITALKIG
jgi:hypothetical protein